MLVAQKHSPSSLARPPRACVPRHSTPSQSRIRVWIPSSAAGPSAAVIWWALGGTAAAVPAPTAAAAPAAIPSVSCPAPAAIAITSRTGAAAAAAMERSEQDVGASAGWRRVDKKHKLNLPRDLHSRIPRPVGAQAVKQRVGDREAESKLQLIPAAKAHISLTKITCYLQ